MTQAVKAPLKAVLRRARHGGASLAVGEPCEAVGDRDRLLVEMEAAFVGSVEITTYITAGPPGGGAPVLRRRAWPGRGRQKLN